MITYQRKLKKQGTRKNRIVGKNSELEFSKEITVYFLQVLLMIKLFHWKTYSYPTHKATDQLYSELNENMDKFIEILLGKLNSRIDLMNQKTIQLIDLNTQESLVQKIKEFKNYLVGLNKNRFMNSMLNSDLFNIRDEILGNMNQFLYLLTFK